MRIEYSFKGYQLGKPPIVLNDTAIIQCLTEYGILDADYILHTSERLVFLSKYTLIST